jgi:hypothetical protein
MCLVIDANAVSKVFDADNAEHPRFKPVAAWVASGAGSVIYGGSTYMRQLGEGKFLSLFVELRKAQRAVSIDDADVDKRELILKERVPDKEFDDAHIVALVGLSKCCLVCTDDLASLPYLKRKDLYPPGVKVPHIYRNLEDRRHCCGRLIVDVCPKRTPAPLTNKKSKKRPRVEIL